MQYFHFSQDSSGIVVTSTSVDSTESPFQLLKRGIKPTVFSIDDPPLIIRPEGQSQDKIQYLIKEVQPFCST